MFKVQPLSGSKLLSVLLVLFAGTIHAAPLTLAEAERIAIDRDAERQRLLEESGAQRDAAIASSALPDPEVRLGAMNLPVDTFAFDQEAMTQVVVGVRQMFPPGDTLEFRKEQGEWMAHGREQQAEDRIRELRRIVRHLWLERQAADHSLEVVRDITAAVKPLLLARETRYSTGGGQQADYLSARLRLDRLDDRAMQQRERRMAAEEMLSRYLGDAARDDYLVIKLPEPDARGALAARLEEHPRVRSHDARIAAGESGEKLADEQFAPRWALDVSYGDRRGLDAIGNERPDLASAMVSMSIPLFNRDEKRRAVSAAERQTRAATYARIDMLREMESRLAETWSRHADVSEQIALHENRLLPTARQALESTERAYANDRVPLDRLMELNIDLLDLELRRVELMKRRDQLRADLYYLGGPAR